MNLNSKSVQNYRGLVFLFSITYLVSYLTRINYGAVISAMESATAFSKQQLSLAVTASFVTYGAGQLLSGVLGDRLPPKKLVLCGLAVTTLMNILLPVFENVTVMTVIWGLNGLAQAFMWPPIVRLMVTLIPREQYSKATVRVMWGSSIGTILIYLVSPILILLASWKSVFWFSGICGGIMIVFWRKFCPDINEVRPQAFSLNDQSRGFVTPFFCLLMVAVAVVGVLRDGVATWTPSLVSESFGLSNASGILSGAIFPVFGMLCYELALMLYHGRFKNIVACAGALFALGSVGCAALVFAVGNSSLASVLMLSVLNGSMHGANLMLTGMLPAFYEYTGKVSTVSGVVNAFVYIGSAISTYGIAVITETFGWNMTVWVWLFAAILGTLICCICAVPLQKLLKFKK